ncbi:MAG: hypothetical protein ACLSST_09525 [Bifidobacterium dentium]
MVIDLLKNDGIDANSILPPSHHRYQRQADLILCFERANFRFA